MFAASRRLAACLAACTVLAACATTDRDIVTPTGPVAGQVNGPFVVLGVADKATSTLNRGNGGTAFIETVSVEVPAGTEVIVPALRGWDLGYGSTDPADLSTQPLPESTFRWNPDDHHLGIATVNVAVLDIDALRPGATTQSARIQIGARLNDNNGDDAWWGVIRYQLIFLGRAPVR